jgi:type IV pilus assembly protein PilC
MPKPAHLKKPLFLKVGAKDQIGFARYLAVMLDAGIPLHESLGVLKEQSTQKSMQYVLQCAIADLADGLQLHTSLAKFPSVFDAFFVNAVNVGESSGTLSATMRYLAVQIEKSEEIRGKVRSALLYPIIVFVGALGIAGYLAFGMLPKLTPMFTQLNVKLPATTQALLNVSNWLTHYWLPLIIGIGIVGVLISLIMRITFVRFALYRSLSYLPIFGNLIRKMQTAKFARILGTLLASGVTIVEALKVTAASTENLIYRQELNTIATAVERGETIAAELKAHPQLFSHTATSMVAIGERTGKLSDSLITLAEFTEREVDDLTKNLSTLIEPLSLILVGVITGFVALSIITPIYQVTQGVHAERKRSGGRPGGRASKKNLPTRPPGRPAARPPDFYESPSRFHRH